MTPTLSGRWQTRALLLLTLGLPITFGFVMVFNSITPLVLLWWTLLFGLAWDVLYDQIQQRRWDHDWPPSRQLAAGIVEALWLALLLYGLPFINSPALHHFLIHYSAVWLAVFFAGQSVMRIIFPHWRFRGGQWI